MNQDPYATGTLTTGEIRRLLAHLNKRLLDLPPSSPERQRITHHRDALIAEQEERRAIRQSGRQAS
jgi:hypothetical protein